MLCLEGILYVARFPLNQTPRIKKNKGNVFSVQDPCNTSASIYDYDLKRNLKTFYEIKTRLRVNHFVENEFYVVEINSSSSKVIDRMETKWKWMENKKLVDSC